MGTKRRISRRDFLAGSLGLAVLAGAGPSGPAHASASIPTRPLGRTGLEITMLGFGGGDIGRMPEAEAAPIVEAALEEGITYLDTASSYGRSEEWIGRVLARTDRSRVVLATKTLKRGYEEALREIERSFKHLKTDRIDLLQVHAVNTPGTLRQVLASDGALRAAVEFKEAGHVSHIGVTGHRRAEVLVEALGAYPFETALFPSSPADSRLHGFSPSMEAAAGPKGVGLLVMKVLGDGALYPHVEACIRYALSRPVACAVVGMRSVEQVRANARLARSFAPMAEAEAAKLEDELKDRANLDVLWWKQ